MRRGIEKKYELLGKCSVSTVIKEFHISLGTRRNYVFLHLLLLLYHIMY